jgi:hypothetical protein
MLIKPRNSSLLKETYQNASVSIVWFPWGLQLLNRMSMYVRCREEQHKIANNSTLADGIVFLCYMGNNQNRCPAVLAHSFVTQLLSRPRSLQSCDTLVVDGRIRFVPPVNIIFRDVSWNTLKHADSTRFSPRVMYPFREQTFVRCVNRQSSKTLIQFEAPPAAMTPTGYDY